MMSLFRSITKSQEEIPDPFEQLYQRSPVPKNILYPCNNASSSPLPRTVPVSSLPVQKSTIFNQLKERSHLHCNRSTVPLNASLSLCEQRIQHSNQLKNQVECRNHDHNNISKSTVNVTHYFDDETVNKSSSWQNGTFSEDLHEKTKSNKSDEVDGTLINNSASLFENQEKTVLINFKQNSDNIGHDGSQMTEDNVKLDLLPAKSQNENQFIKSKYHNSVQSGASIFKKIKMLSPNNDMILSEEMNVISEEDQENQEPGNKTLTEEFQPKETSYPLEIEVAIQTEKDQEAFKNKTIKETSNNLHDNNTVGQIGKIQQELTPSTESRSYKLYSWIIKPLPEVGGICVEGKKSPNDDQFFHSSLVTIRNSKKTVTTANGSKYTLIGNMEKLDALDAGITEDLVKYFAKGFPIQWKTLIADYFKKVKFVDEPIEKSSPKVVEEEKVEKHLSKKTPNTHNIEIEEDASDDPEASSNAITNKKKVKEYTLTEWIIKPITNTEDICVEGKKCDANTDEFWHSTAIDHILDKRTLVTSSGSIYKLQGNICKLDTLEAGFSQRVVKAFKDGFPKAWKLLIKGHFALLKKQSAEDAILTPKAQAPGKHTVNSTACTPSGVIFELENIKKSRSGRVVKPTLAWWAGQKIKINSDNTFELTHNSSVTPEIFKAMASSYKAFTPKYQRYINTSTYSKSRERNRDSSEIQNSENVKSDCTTLEIVNKNKDSKTKKRKSGQENEVTNPISKRKSSAKQKNETFDVKKQSQSKANSSGKRNSVTTKDTDLDSMIGDLYDTVKQASSKRKSDKVKKDTCYSKLSKPVNDQLSAEETYSVDMDSDFEEDDEIPSKKRKQSSKKGKSSAANQSSSGSKGEKKKATVKHSEGINSSNNRKLKKNTNSEENSNISRPRSLRTRTKSYNKRMEECLNEINTESESSNKTTKSKDRSKKEKVSVDLTRSSEESGDEDDFSKKTDTVKAKRTQSILNKLPENSQLQGEDDSSKKTDTVKAKRTQSRLNKLPENSQLQGEDDSSKKTDTVKAKKTQSRLNKPPENNQLQDENDSSKKTDTVKAKKTQSKLSKPPENNQLQDEDVPWTKQETTRLNKAVADIPGDDPNFWEIVSERVKTRNKEACLAHYYKDIPKPISKKKTVTNSANKNDVKAITAKKGTLKRKQQLREFIEHHNKGYEDDLFESTPYRNQGGIKIPKLMDDSDGDIFEEMSKKHPELLNRIYTPLTRIHLDPVSEKKTPATSSESPCIAMDRKDAEQYIHQIQKRRQLKGRKILDKAKTPVNKKNNYKTLPSPTKNLFGKPVDTQSLFMDEGSSSDNYEDSDNEKDYYWSDFENN